MDARLSLIHLLFELKMPDVSKRSVRHFWLSDAIYYGL